VASIIVLQEDPASLATESAQFVTSVFDQSFVLTCTLGCEGSSAGGGVLTLSVTGE
jgi:hypothetical protein